MTANGNHRDRTSLARAYTRKLAFENRICVQWSPLLFLGLRNCWVHIVPPAKALYLYLSILPFWFEDCEFARTLAITTVSFFAYTSFLLMLCALGDYMRNILTGKNWALTFCAFLGSYRFGVLAGFCHKSHMRLVKDHDLGVRCTVPFQVQELFEHHGTFCQLDVLLWTPRSATLLFCQTMTAAWCVPRFVSWFPCSRDTDVVQPSEEYCATLGDHGESV